MGDDVELIEAINKLERATKKSNSIGWGFLRGLAAAIGGTIGLAILITIAIYILTKIPDTNTVGRFFHALANIIDRNQH